MKKPTNTRALEFLSTLSLRRATVIGEALTASHSFLSTLSLRRATAAGAVSCYLLSYFYPRSPCGERHLATWKPDYICRDFYPRSPCGERQLIWRYLTPKALFLSTLSLRRATLLLMAHPVGRKNFYPRSPCGERRFYKLNKRLFG